MTQSTYDTMAQIFVIWSILLLLACPICSAIVASSKGRSRDSWFILGLIFGPFGLLAIVGMPSLLPVLVEYADDPVEPTNERVTDAVEPQYEGARSLLAKAFWGPKGRPVILR